jgi:hypothetical protein
VGLSVCWHGLCHAHMTRLHGALEALQPRAQCTAGQHNPGEAGACIRNASAGTFAHSTVLTWIAGDLVCRSGVATWALEANRAAGQKCVNPGSGVKGGTVDVHNTLKPARSLMLRQLAAPWPHEALTRWGRSAQRQSRCPRGKSREPPEWG